MKRAVFDGEPCWRVVATRHPPIAIFQRVADLEAFDALYELEVAFSPHYDELALLRYLPRSEWVFGPGSGHVMAPFAYPCPSRFSDGSFGVYYAGLEEVTAIQEVAFHRGLFMKRTAEPPSVLEEQILCGKLTGRIVDIRGQHGSRPDLYAPDPKDYSPAQAFGAGLRGAGETGLAFSSVRQSGGACVGLFRPKALADCRALRQLKYIWDGEVIAGWA